MKGEGILALEGEEPGTLVVGGGTRSTKQRESAWLKFRVFILYPKMGEVKGYVLPAAKPGEATPIPATQDSRGVP